MMNKTVQNASWLIGVKIVQSVFTLIITMLTARFLGPSDFGLINYAASIVAFVVPLMNLGFSSTLVHELIMNKDNEGEIMGTAIGGSLCSSFLCIAGVLAFVKISSPGEPETLIVCGLYSLVLTAQALELNVYWFQAHLMSKYSSLIAFAAYVLVSLYKIFLLASGKSIYWFALSNAMDIFIIAFLQFHYYFRLGGSRLHFSKKTFRRMLEKSKYYIVSALMISVFAQTDRIMLKLMVDDSAVGFYSASLSCAHMTSFVFTAIINSASPDIFESKKISEDEFRRKVRYLYSVIIYGSLLQNVLICVFAKPAIFILYGRDFYPAVKALRIILWYTTFSYLGAVRNRWILAEGKQHLIWKIDSSGAAANVILNYLLIPRYGISGAAFASLVTQFFTNVIVTAAISESRPSIRIMLQSLNPRCLRELFKELRA